MHSAALADAVAYADRWLAYRRRTLWLPGLTYAVGHAGKLVGAGAHGVADLSTDEPLTVEHRFRIASQSKMFTAVAVGQLVDHELLRLDDPIGTHVPGLAPAVGAVTVRDLLSHGGGVIRDSDDASFWDLDTAFPAGAELPARAGAEPVLPPALRFKYSNIAYGLLGRAIESASGRSYDDWVRAEILHPLGMSQTSTDLVDGGGLAPMATGHSSGRGGAERRPVPHVPAAGLVPAAGFCSTVGDMVRFGAALCEDGDGRVLSAAMRRRMQQAQWQVSAKPPRHYALGLATVEVDDRVLFGHGGAYIGFITSTLFDPGDGVVVSVMTNAIDGPAQDLAAGVVGLVHLAQRLADEPAGGDTDVLDRFTGRFSGLWSTIDIARLGGHLVGLDPDLVDPTQLTTRLGLQPDGTLRITDGPGYGPVGEPVSLDGDQLVWAGHRLRREAG